MARGARNRCRWRAGRRPTSWAERTRPLILRRTLLLVLLLPSLAAAQSSPEDQARGLLEDGRTYRKEGKLKQALDNFQTIVSGFPNTSFVDDALLEIGRYYLEVDHDAAKARDAFDQVTKRSPHSHLPPPPYHYPARLTITRP